MQQDFVVEDPALELLASREKLVETAQTLADQFALDTDLRGAEAPKRELDVLAEHGLLTAPLPVSYGGLGLGTEPHGHSFLLRILAAIGGGDLALGRLYEGHVNALVLIASYGSPEQLRQAAIDAHSRLLFGVWNTGDVIPMRLEPPSSNKLGYLLLSGSKTFASGAAFVQRPIVTAEYNGWQMTLPRMETSDVARAVVLDSRSWYPMGMAGSESYTVGFTGARLTPEDLIGKPGDFYRDPLFRGGAIRFAAVQAGSLVRLVRKLSHWLVRSGRSGDAYQLARMGEVALGAEDAMLWIERAAVVAEDCLRVDATAAESRRMVEFANMTRLSIERTATALMPKIIASIGAHGLLRPAGFERDLRDLTMYLRQPNPDGVLADVGRSAIEAAHAWQKARP